MARLRQGHWRIALIIAVVVIGVGSGIGVAAANNSSRASARAKARDLATATATASKAARTHALNAGIHVTPAAGTTDVALDAPLLVTTAIGTFTTFEVTTSTGAPVSGQFATPKNAWTATGALQPSTTYNISLSVADGHGETAHVKSAFTTVAAAGRISATLFPVDNMTVGVAQPVVIRFSHPVTTPAAQADALRHLFVSASKPVAGGWHWFSPTELHFRPATYWPSGDKVEVRSDLDGWDAGGGWWGSPGAHHVAFTIGDAHVSVANLATHQMVVKSNGQVVATYPMSGGSAKYPTMNGNHIVLDRESVVHMVSSSNGIPVDSPDGYDELVYNDVHISDSGEYVHAAPWSVSSQGRENVSHGCINLSDADSLAFMNFSRIGDLVQVVGGPRVPELHDHGVMDWDTPWSQWTPADVAQA